MSRRDRRITSQSLEWREAHCFFPPRLGGRRRARDLGIELEAVPSRDRELF
jgi:hypothetical protein